MRFPWLEVICICLQESRAVYVSYKGKIVTVSFVVFSFVAGRELGMELEDTDRYSGWGEELKERGTKTGE